MPRGIYSSPKRGLASASQATRQRVASLGGYVCAIKLGDLYCEARSEKGGFAFIAKYGNRAVGRSDIIKKIQAQQTQQGAK